MMKRILITLLALALLSGCGGSRVMEPDPVGEAESAAAPQAVSRPEAESRAQSAPQPAPEPESQPEPQPERGEALTGAVPVAAPFGQGEPYALEALGDEVVLFRAEGGVLRALRYNPLAGEELPEQTVRDFGEERVLNWRCAGRQLFVTTDRAVYRFDDGYVLEARAELPGTLFAGEVRLDYWRKSFLVNDQLTYVVYRGDASLEALALTGQARPVALVDHPFVPEPGTDSVEVKVYTPLAFLSESEVLVAIGQWEWWGGFATVRLDTGELRPLFAGEHLHGAMLYTHRDALATSGDGDVTYLDYETGAQVAVPFLTEGDVQGYFYDGPVKFHSPEWYARCGLPGEDGGAGTVTFHRGDYAAGVERTLPFSVRAQEAHIVWVGGAGDMLFWYRTGDGMQGGGEYGLARAA